MDTLFWTNTIGEIMSYFTESIILACLLDSGLSTPGTLYLRYVKWMITVKKKKSVTKIHPISKTVRLVFFFKGRRKHIFMSDLVKRLMTGMQWIWNIIFFSIFLPNSKHVICLTVLPYSKILRKDMGQFSTIQACRVLSASCFFLFPDHFN